MNDVITVKVKTQELTKDIQKVNEEFSSYFTRKEIVELMQNVRNTKHLLILQTLWMTGVRVTELISMHKEDLKPLEHKIRIRWLKNRKYLFRYIPFPRGLILPLQTYTSNLKHDDKIFPYTRQMIFKICRKNGFEHPHKIRHSYAYNFLNQSKNTYALKILQELLGHSHINTTLRYARVTMTDQINAIDEVKFV